MIKYLIEKSEIPNRDAFYQWVQSHLSPKLETRTMATLAEQWKAEGRVEGYQNAVQEGVHYERVLLNRLLTRRFGRLSQEILYKLEQADAETLLKWGEKILDTKTIEDVFEQ